MIEETQVRNWKVLIKKNRFWSKLNRTDTHLLGKKCSHMHKCVIVSLWCEWMRGFTNTSHQEDGFIFERLHLLLSELALRYVNIVMWVCVRYCTRAPRQTIPNKLELWDCEWCVFRYGVWGGLMNITKGEFDSCQNMHKPTSRSTLMIVCDIYNTIYVCTYSIDLRFFIV